MAKPATFVLNCVRPRPQLQHLHPCAALEREARSHRHDAAGVRTVGTLTVMESLLTLHSGPEELVLIHGDLRHLVPCAEWLLPSASAAELPLASELPWEQLQNCAPASECSHHDRVLSLAPCKWEQRIYTEQGRRRLCTVRCQLEHEKEPWSPGGLPLHEGGGSPSLAAQRLHEH
ncbi:uncharacterized protein [Vicugna pacos]|uniref:Uncharacterized protein isoform X2 n=1 Tax=Vicugna pacos TaxID=30538 RepID=A0ABM5C6V5_VICPA